MTNYAIIAGKGKLPEALKARLPEAKLIGLEGTLPDIACDLTTKFGMVGQLLEYLKANNVTHVTFAGSISRPNLKDIKPDAEGAKLLTKLLAGSFFGGDNNLLTTLVKFFEGKGLTMVGAHEIMPELLTPAGQLGKHAPASAADIAEGMKAAHKLGKKDIGQAVIMQDGKLLLEEDKRGTKDLIKRAAAIVTGDAFLVKACKPQQDKRVDLPAIGVKTINQLHEAKISGVVLEAGSSLILEREEVIKRADELGIFVFGA